MTLAERELSPDASDRPEDLEELADDSIELPPGKLDAVRRRYAPPQSWYDQEESAIEKGKGALEKLS